VRLKNIAAGKADLLNVLTNRYRNNNIVLGSDDQQQLLAKIKEERRKELLFRGIRWSDIRRYNVLDKDNIKIVRNLDAQVFELKPMDKRFVFPFPKVAIDFGGYENN
jgi:sialic acid synthase SpsE